MTDQEMPAREYTRPPMTRGVDPQRMNWLWQLIVQATGLDAAEVRLALHTIGVAATDQRVASWSTSDRDDNYFPLTLAELERNLRALVVLKQARAQASDDASAQE